MMNIEQMKVFKAVIDHEGVINASKKLHKSQPAISNVLNRIEKEFEFKLFDRNSYRIKLTTEGEAVYQKVTAILSNVASLDSLINNISSGFESELRVSIEILTPLMNYFEIFRKIQRASPSTNLFLISDVMSAGFNRLINKEVDLFIGPRHKELGDTEAIKIDCIKIVPVFSPEFPALEEKELNRGTLSNYPQITVNSFSKEASDESAGILDGSVTWNVSDFKTKKDLIINGLGWGYMPLHLIKCELSSGQLMTKNFDKESIPEISIYLFKRANENLKPVASLFWSLMRNYVE